MEDAIRTEPEHRAFLDSIGARILALVIAVLAGYLLFLAQQRYEGTPSGLLAGVDRAAFDACVDERMAAFERLAERAGYSDERRAVAEEAARASARVVCAEQARPFTQ